MKKKITVLLLVLAVAFFAMPDINVRAAAANITVTKTVSDDNVEKGDTFNLVLSVKNNENDTISNVSATIGNCSFNVVNGSSTQTYSGSITKGNEGLFMYRLSYDGGSTTTIPITINYKLAGLDMSYSDSVKVNTSEHNTAGSNPNASSDTSKYVPILTIANDSMPVGWAGGYIEIPLNIKNISTHTSKNITVTPVLDSDSPFAIDTVNLTHNIDEIQAGKDKTVSLKFSINRDVQEKVYSLKINLKYYNAFGDIFNNVNTGGSPEVLYIKMLNPNTSPKLNINNIEFSRPTVQPGQDVNIKLSIENGGSLTAKDIKVSLTGLKDDGFSLFKDTNIKAIDSIIGNGTSTVSYAVSPSKKMETGSYGLTAKIEYKDESGKSYSSEQQFFIPVENGSTGKTVPKIILSQYSSEPTIAKAGQNFKLKLIFQNTSREKPVQNIKIFFTVPDGGTSGNVFTPVNGSNTFYVDNISPKGTYEKTIEFFTIPDASPKTYTLTANFEYEDDKGVEYKASDIIGIPVSQQISLDTSDIDIPQELFAGQPMPVGFDLYNTGKVQLRNMMIRLEGDFNMQNGRYFIGNFDAGASDRYEGTVIPNAPGQVKGAVIMSYDEPTGEHREIKKEFTLNVTQMPAPVMGKDGMPEGMNPKMINKGKPANKTGLWIGLGLGGAAIAAVIVFLVIRKKRKAGITLDE